MLKDSTRWRPGLLAAMLGFLLLLPAMSQAQDALLAEARRMFQPIPAQPPETPENPVTPSKVALGRLLFFEPRISSSQVVACATCHNLALGGMDRQPTSVGHRWQIGPRNAPTVFNAVFNIAQFWDGRSRDLAEQAGNPMMNPKEMASSPEWVTQVLASMPGYVSLFQEAFPYEAAPVNMRNVTRALQAFETTLLTPDAPFDLYLKGGEDALTAGQKKGLALFMAKGCAACHMSMNLGGNGYYRFGAKQPPEAKYLPPEDLGCSAVTADLPEQYVFKAPSLRNVARTAPYLHAGTAWTLAETVTVMARAQLDLAFTPAETTELVAFLQALTGRLPTIQLPELPLATDQTPHPQR